jgi:hypothetical protein
MANSEATSNAVTSSKVSLEAPGEDRAARAYAGLLAEIEAVPESALIPIKVDVLMAVTNALGSLPEVFALRPEFEAAFKDFDFARFDRLEEYVLAAHHAHALWRIASAPKADLAVLAAELNEGRDRLLASAQALVLSGLIAGERLKDVKKLSGYRPLAGDMAALAGMFREHWGVVQNKTPLSLADLDRYAEKAADLLAAVGVRDQGQVTVGDAALNRQRAFALFARVYDSARRAVLYLRPDEGDAIAPSLYAGRGGRPPREIDEVEDENEAAAAKPAAARAGESRPGTPLVINNPSGLPASAPLV